MKARIINLNDSGIYQILNICLFTMTLVLLFAYVYFVNATIYRIVAWQKAQKEVAVLGPSLSGIETEYLSLERGITMAKAKEMNFQAAVDPQFISREPLGKGLSLNNNL